MSLKFVFIVVCFMVALGSYFFCKNKRDWFWGSLALGFTLVADFFLVLHDWHLPGVAVFCFAHLAYIMRAMEHRRGLLRRSAPRNDERKPLPLLWFLFLVIAVVLTILAFVWVDAIFVVSALYATLFISNIIISARYLQHNRWLAITGLLLFLACDICVLLFNLPRYIGAPAWLTGVFPLIWVFYLPSQVLLSVSAVDFRR